MLFGKNNGETFFGVSSKMLNLSFPCMEIMKVSREFQLWYWLHF